MSAPPELDIGAVILREFAQAAAAVRDRPRQARQGLLAARVAEPLAIELALARAPGRRRTPIAPQDARALVGVAHLLANLPPSIGDLIWRIAEGETTAQLAKRWHTPQAVLNARLSAGLARLVAIIDADAADTEQAGAAGPSG